MTKQNVTTKRRGVQPSVKVGDVFINNQGCEYTIINYVNKKNVVIQFNDKYKHTAKTFTLTIRKGSIKNPYHPSVCGIGYMGSGKYISHANGRHTYEYQVWRDMIRRCYDSKTKLRLPTYDDCKVHPDWHNFQVFAEWYTKQDYYGIGYQLDKDLLVEGNKIYSADTCALVPAEINTLLGLPKTKKGDLPTGVCYNKEVGKYSAYLGVDGGKVFLGYFTCSNQAYRAYKISRKKYIKSKALEWKGKIDDRVFHSLIKTSENIVIN